MPDEFPRALSVIAPRSGHVGLEGIVGLLRLGRLV